LHKVKGKQKEISKTKNHKTPAFIWAKLWDILVEQAILPPKKTVTPLAEESCQGGTTDVGKHTRSLPRNTSFPLVASVLNAMLYLNGDLERQEFYKVMSVYYLHHLT
jgi:hypothetical protein